MIPWYLKGKPYGAQSESLNRSEGHEGWGDWLDPGLGKTAVNLNRQTHLAMQDQLLCSIGLVPFSILNNWQREAKKMGFGGTMINWHDIKKDPMAHVKGDLPNILINYESFITEPAQTFTMELLKKFGKDKMMGWIDESSRIKSFDSERSKAAQWLGQRVKFPITMTGSAMTKDPTDLWPQLHYMRATNMYPYPFRNRYCVRGGFKGKQIVGIQNEAELSAMLARHTFLGKKEDWADLPKKIYMPPRQVEMTGKQLNAYREMLEDFITIVDGQEFEANLVLNQLQKLQQIACGFIKNGDEVLDLCPGKNKNPRINEVINILEETPTKTIVFVWHSWAVDKLLECLKPWNPAVIRGGQKPGFNTEQEFKFNTDSSCRVLVNQIAAGGIGLTLLGGNSPVTGGVNRDRCNNTIYFENSFNLEHRIQSEDRNHRYGQDMAVTYWDIVSSSIDVKTIEALISKKLMAETILNPDFWGRVHTTKL